MRLRVATFNLRNLNDRWEERRSLMVAQFAALAPALAGLQEVLLEGEGRQDDLLAAIGREHPAKSFGARSERFPAFGNAILVGAGEPLAHELLPLGSGRVAQRVLVALPEGLTLWFANTHLHHRRDEPGVREVQARQLAAWLLEAPAADAVVCAGDFNGPPSERAYAAMQTAGFRSASLAANGAEPVTWPSGIQAETMDTDGEAGCYDYLWLAGGVRALSAWVACNQPAAEDPTLYPSDHYAVAADVDVGVADGG